MSGEDYAEALTESRRQFVETAPSSWLGGLEEAG